MINYRIFTSKEHFLAEGPKWLGSINAFWNWDHRLELRYQIAEDPRSKAQLKLYRVWLRHLAEYFSNATRQFSEDDMHDLMRHKFLGYETRVIGETEIVNQLKSTADGKIAKHVMSEFMFQVDQWATEMGCYLPHPEDNEYTKYRQARQ